VRALNRALTVTENVLAAGTLGAAALIAIVAVILRNVFNTFLFWSEESIIYLIIFSTFLGAVITLRSQEHVNVDVIATFLGRRGKQVMALLALVITLIYLAGVGYFAWLLLFEPFSTSTSTPALDLPLWVVESSVALGFTLMFLRAIELLVRVWRHGVEEGDAVEVEAQALGMDVDDLDRLRGDEPGDGPGDEHRRPGGTRPDDKGRDDS
jgi:C4-dicarboxylate transporter, DctQ subunit